MAQALALGGARHRVEGRAEPGAAGSYYVMQTAFEPNSTYKTVLELFPTEMLGFLIGALLFTFTADCRTIARKTIKRFPKRPFYRLFGIFLALNLFIVC